jgi:ribosomal protein S10
MLLEKIKQHAWKLLFLLIGTLLLLVWLVFSKQRSLDQARAKQALAEQALFQAQVNKLNEAQIKAQAVQDAMAAYRQQQLDSVANNPITVAKQETVPVTTVVPGATRKITVPVATSTSSSSSSSKTTSTPAPAKSTKTS